MSILNPNICPQTIDIQDFYIKRRYFNDPDYAKQHVIEVIHKLYINLIKFEPKRPYHTVSPEEMSMANAIERFIDPILKIRGHLMSIFRCEEFNGRRYFMFRLVDHIINLTIVDIEFFA